MTFVMGVKCMELSAEMRKRDKHADVTSYEPL